MGVEYIAQSHRDRALAMGHGGRRIKEHRAIGYFAKAFAAIAEARTRLCDGMRERESVCVCTSVCVCVCTRESVCMYERVCVYVCTRGSVRMYVCLYYIYAYMYICVYVWR